MAADPGIFLRDQTACGADLTAAGLNRGVLRFLRGGTRRVPVVDRQRVAVGIGEDRLLADAAVDHVGDELGQRDNRCSTRSCADRFRKYECRAAGR